MALLLLIKWIKVMNTSSTLEKNTGYIFFFMQLFNSCTFIQGIWNVPDVSLCLSPFTLSWIINFPACHIVFIFKRCVIVIRKNPTFSLQKTYIKKKKHFIKPSEKKTVKRRRKKNFYGIKMAGQLSHLGI